MTPIGPRSSAAPGALAIVVMWLGVALVYLSPQYADTVLIGLDYLQLHAFRMQFAREALLAGEFTLPAWYPRELLGTPFWSNIQNFPLIPTRLLVLLTMDPLAPYFYGLAVTLSASLAALFAYLYLRKVGLGRTACAAAGWTFACSGFYAARVAAGHLPLLEGYPALPLLLWVIESHLQRHRRGESSRRWIAAIAVSSACVMLAGHPQVPVYAMVAGGIYALWRSQHRAFVRVWIAMIVGVGCSAFALVPMALLIGRSTRVLALAPAANDIAMPYRRLLAFFLPWRDGAPPLLDNNAAGAFNGYPNLAYFWDTVCYIGIVPWAAVVLLLVLLTRIKLDAERSNIAAFVGLLGVSGIVMSLPILQQVGAFLPGTFFRSPARLIYLTQFSLAVALGGALHAALSSKMKAAHWAAVLLLTVHVIDLGLHDRRFIHRGALMRGVEAEAVAKIIKQVGDARAAIDQILPISINRTVDDIGFFDSIMLARSYRLVMNLAGMAPDLNIQNFNGSEMPQLALAAMGVTTMLTTSHRKDLMASEQIRGINVYQISSPARRAEFFAADRIRYLPAEQIQTALRQGQFPLSSELLMPMEAKLDELTTVPMPMANDSSPTVEYRRPHSDRIECTVTTSVHGYLRILESWDPGWSATVDGTPVSIVPALDALLAVPMAPGRHEVSFVYRTPGASTGGALSLLSLVLLCGLVWSTKPAAKREP